MPRVRTDKFFQEQSAHSRVKADIVAKFVVAWAKVFLTSKRNEPLASHAAYVDFFSGPGTYDDGNESTPLIIARKVLASDPLRSGLQMFFNDSELPLVQSLEQETKKLEGFSNLRFPPTYLNEKASIELVDSLGLSFETPQFFFLDQFGYADVTPALVKRIFQARRCDCAVFVRTSRLIAAVSNAASESVMKRLFGETRLLYLRAEFKKSFADKESLLLASLREVMREAGVALFQPFPFRIRHEGSSKQHLIYLGKHELGLSIMKDIMSKSSSSDEAGVPVMGFAEGSWTPSLFEIDPIDDLVTQLGQEFAGKTVRVGELYSRHHPKSDRFLLRHYQEAIRRLEKASSVICLPAATDRPMRSGIITMSETVSVTFPARSSR